MGNIRDTRRDYILLQLLNKIKAITKVLTV